MNRNLRLVLILIMSTFLSSLAYSQSATLTSGGEAKGSDINVSYSIGQVFYLSTSNSSGSVIVGVQQPYQIATSIDDDLYNSQSIKVYPNPTTSYQELFYPNPINEGLFYQIYDLAGVLLVTSKIENTNSTIPLNQMPSGMYVLRIIRNNNIEKTLKIIKL